MFAQVRNRATASSARLRNSRRGTRARTTPASHGLPDNADHVQRCARLWFDATRTEPSGDDEHASRAACCAPNAPAWHNNYLADSRVRLPDSCPSFGRTPDNRLSRRCKRAMAGDWSSTAVLPSGLGRRLGLGLGRRLSLGLGRRPRFRSRLGLRFRFGHRFLSMPRRRRPGAPDRAAGRDARTGRDAASAANTTRLIWRRVGVAAVATALASRSNVAGAAVDMHARLSLAQGGRGQALVNRRIFRRLPRSPCRGPRERRSCYELGRAP
jgi:hypothetical protein